ncbi:hypothetical protein JYB64_04565 [Algoriphagus aestuarii]|nr:hypothetical protein [Algoriphagus aestuarii]
MKFNYSILIVSFFLALTSCNLGGRNGENLEVLPYFDLKGFMEMTVKGLEEAKVTKISRVNGKETQVEITMNEAQWREELDVFFEADINKSSLISSYDTRVKNEYLIHELLPNAKGVVKNMTISIINDKVHLLQVSLARDNVFYSSVTHADLYISNRTQKLDHYTIETTQKIWFLKPNNIKISGSLRF